MILGGSTNAVLHLIAIAHSVGIKLTIDDFQSVSDRIPFLGDLKPSGKYVMEDVHKIGGIPCRSLSLSSLSLSRTSAPDTWHFWAVILTHILSSIAVLKYLHQNKLIDGSIMTVTGKTLAENLELAKDMPYGQDVIRPLSNPIKSTGHIRCVILSHVSSRSCAKLILITNRQNSSR